MFNFFKRSRNGQAKKTAPIQFVDLDGTPMSEGDEVIALRYELGRCKIIKDEHGFAYESIDSGKVVSMWRMVDAATSHQKVRKL
ncbi:MAG: hypothetical protein AAF587_27610 [Bacteroidota bacterium]